MKELRSAKRHETLIARRKLHLLEVESQQNLVAEDSHSSSHSAEGKDSDTTTEDRLEHVEPAAHNVTEDMSKKKKGGE